MYSQCYHSLGVFDLVQSGEVASRTMLGMHLLSWFLIGRVVLHGAVAVIFIFWQGTVLHRIMVGVSLGDNGQGQSVYKTYLVKGASLLVQVHTWILLERPAIVNCNSNPNSLHACTKHSQRRGTGQLSQCQCTTHFRDAAHRRSRICLGSSCSVFASSFLCVKETRNRPVGVVACVESLQGILLLIYLCVRIAIRSRSARYAFRPRQASTSAAFTCKHSAV